MKTKFALCNGERIEATKGAKGICGICGAEMIAKCGEIKIHHWAHKTECTDHWWESETEWHRNWKNEFPIEWQEVTQEDERGEKHRADVKTTTGWTIEFQHSAISREERDSREHFYSKLIWVVDGTKRKTDFKQFQQLLDKAILIADKPSISKADFAKDNRLIREWGSSESLVLIDFGDSSIDELWLICQSNNVIFVSAFLRNSFIELLNNSKSDEVYRVLIDPIQKEIKGYKAREKKRELRKKKRELREKDRRKIAAEEATRKFLKAMAREPVDQRIAYVIGICKNRFGDIDVKVASTTLKGFVKALNELGCSDNEIVDEFEIKVIPKTKETNSWKEWKNLMEQLKQRIGKK